VPARFRITTLTLLLCLICGTTTAEITLVNLSPVEAVVAVMTEEVNLSPMEAAKAMTDGTPLEILAVPDRYRYNGWHRIAPGKAAKFPHFQRVLHVCQNRRPLTWQQPVTIGFVRPEPFEAHISVGSAETDAEMLVQRGFQPVDFTVFEDDRLYHISGNAFVLNTRNYPLKYRSEEFAEEVFRLDIPGEVVAARCEGTTQLADVKADGHGRQVELFVTLRPRKERTGTLGTPPGPSVQLYKTHPAIVEGTLRVWYVTPNTVANSGKPQIQIVGPNTPSSSGKPPIQIVRP
jgi:hypothetical protein